MAILETIKKILNECNINYSLSGLLRKQLILELSAQEENFICMFQKLNEVFNEPKFVADYYGYIWQINEKYLAFNIINDWHSIGSLTLYIFNKLPLSKRIEYSQYVQFDSLIKQMLRRYKFTCDNFIHFHGNEYLLFGESDNNHCLILLKKNYLNFYYSRTILTPEGNKCVIPTFNKKIKVDKKDLATLQKIISDCFMLIQHSANKNM